MEIKYVKEKIKFAKKAVEDEDEQFKVPAFQVILSNLLNSDKNISQDNNNTDKESKPKPKPKEVEEDENEVFDKINVNELQYLNSLKSVHDKCLALLAYASKNILECKGITSDEMKKIFAERFGLTTITANNISMSLKYVTGKYVTRKEISVKTSSGKIKKYRYEILQKGLEFIEEKISKITRGKE